ncbi:hypothetical protein [Streptomyces sp. NPDC046759]|uniref:hypothetical protein n=1 Tax=Streptomyces sp. NPDC046759 TaxID=3155019 RepID=UPI0033C6304A
MTETWTFEGGRMSVTVVEAVTGQWRGITEGRPETWPTGSAGRPGVCCPCPATRNARW